MNVDARVEQRGGDRDRREALADREARSIFLTQRGAGAAVEPRARRAQRAACSGRAGRGGALGAALGLLGAAGSAPRRGRGDVARLLERRLRRRRRSPGAARPG